MESWPLLEENPWSFDTDISWVEEKEVWANQNNPQEAIEYPEWFLQTKPEPCPDISTILLPYIEFEDIVEKEKPLSEIVITHPWKELPGFNLTKYEFFELLTWDGIEGNLGNQSWDEIFKMDEHFRESLFWRTWKCQDWFNLQDFEIEIGKISKISRGYIINKYTWDFYWEETLIPAILRIRSGSAKINTEDWDSFSKEHLFKALKSKRLRGGNLLKKELVDKITGQTKPLKN
ncbi:hypothetical protein O181_046197 [Austropuccinia psidii MF-1]|uniref:Uncharacterized protein n=1 Tax=Austropuccinia psidii MF-1 TaxID=1389203 RepID=A0A9Q3DQS5_9BASI|nr:hypothetical protein [Austropuccinia psidii MF-1]